MTSHFMTLVSSHMVILNIAMSTKIQTKSIFAQKKMILTSQDCLLVMLHFHKIFENQEAFSDMCDKVQKSQKAKKTRL